MKFLIGYDIAGNRARSRVAKYLEGKACSSLTERSGRRRRSGRRCSL